MIEVWDLDKRKIVFLEILKSFLAVERAIPDRIERFSIHTESLLFSAENWLRTCVFSLEQDSPLTLNGKRASLERL